LPSPPTEADRAAAEAVLRRHVEKAGSSREDAVAVLLAALAEPPPTG
jgi:hypothetical protein